MPFKRLIPVLLIKEDGLIHRSKFDENTDLYVGDPINTINIFNDYEVDELILLDLSARSFFFSHKSTLVKATRFIIKFGFELSIIFFINLVLFFLFNLFLNFLSVNTSNFFFFKYEFNIVPKDPDDPKMSIDFIQFNLLNVFSERGVSNSSSIFLPFSQSPIILNIFFKLK